VAITAASIPSGPAHEPVLTFASDEQAARVARIEAAAARIAAREKQALAMSATSKASTRR